jgi:diguanylate cyclase (GGDEF)-like protein
MLDILDEAPDTARLAMVDESARLVALDTYDILDTSREEIFDRITRLARRVFNIQTSMVSFVDAHRRWYKSCVGPAASETPRGPTFCNYAVQTGSELIVLDTLADLRFCDNVLVTGGPRIRFYAGIPLRPNNGPVIGTFCIIDPEPRRFDEQDLNILRDLARMAEMALELRTLASVDSLTGAHTRRAFHEEFERIRALGARHGHDVSLIMLDIDHFKQVNDKYGHVAGDVVLRGIVDVCRNALRATDFLGRLGGEEFAIALSNTDRANALKVAEQLRKAVELAEFDVDATRIRVTASLGVATQDGVAETTDLLVARADQALYAAKTAGRNRSIAANNNHYRDDGQRVLKAGLISFNAGNSVIECTVRRLASSSAHLQVALATVLPDTFKLRIEADGLSRMCRILERQGATVIVAM